LAGTPSTDFCRCSRNSSAFAGDAESITSQPLSGSIQPKVLRLRTKARGSSSRVISSWISRISLAPDAAPFGFFDGSFALSLAKRLTIDAGSSFSSTPRASSHCWLTEWISAPPARGAPSRYCCGIGGTASLQGQFGELFFKPGGVGRPVPGEAVEMKVLEPHGRTRKSRGL
jgi:hypothetical protein